jgi:EAL domain-containing protein (putative c-di-GMP-specific phosphodiesterase class I)
MSKFNLSVNIGIAAYPKNASNFDELLKNADTALYNAIVNRCKCLYYNDGMNYAIMERLQLMSGLKTAMDNSEFLLYYQPQYRSRDKKIVGFEALVRWNSGKFGLISPAKFIPLAEESMLIIPLGNWILEEAVKFLKHLHTEGYEDLIVSVNISVIQLIQQNFAESVLEIINAYDIPPQCVELEITESAAIESADIVLENMKELRSKGVRFALDDFGTGYSSLNYVTSLPINTLKIDKSFIDSIGKANDIGFLTGYIIEIGRKLGLSVVAEGVETEIQFKYLEKKHCERIQGFLLSRPVSADKAEKLIVQEYVISDSLFTG